MVVVLGLPAFGVPYVCQMILWKVVFVIELQCLWPWILVAVVTSRETYLWEPVSNTACHSAFGTVCVPVQAFGGAASTKGCEF